MKSLLKGCAAIAALALPVAALSLAGLVSPAVSYAEDNCDYSFYLNTATNQCQFCDDSMSWNYDTNQCLANVDVYVDPNPLLGPNPIVGPVGPVGVGGLGPVAGPVGPVGVGGLGPVAGPVGPVGIGRR